MRAVAVTAALAAALAAGCLDVPEGVEAECATTDDCNASAGEVCDEGLCWGDPPDVQLAAVVSPPSERTDLVAKELMQLAISDDGWIDGLMLEAPVTWTGRVEELCEEPRICTRVALGATITVTRPSPFQGGPGFKAVIDATAGAAGAAFTLALPRSRPGDAPYTVTIVPEGRDLEPEFAISAAQVVPPLRMELWADGDIDRTIYVGGADLPEVIGAIQTAAGLGLSHHRVVALGRWAEGQPLTEVSTVDYTGADGSFRLRLSPGLVGTVEIVARPYGGAAAPTLHLPGVSATTSSQRVLQQPPALGSPSEARIEIAAQDTNGAITPVRGALVRATASFASATGSGRAILVSEGTTDDAGKVTLTLLDGATFADRYRLQVVPPASAKVGVLYDEPLPVAASYERKLLPARVPVRGRVTDAEGAPLKDVAVTARPSLRFVWSLDDLPQAFLQAIPAPTTLTPDTGEFVLFVDRTVADLWGHYDLVFEPSPTARAPGFVVPEVEIPRDDRKEVELRDEVRLPDAAFVRGLVTDSTGAVVEEAELKVFRITPELLSVCTQVLNAPASCPVPAGLQGRGSTDRAGIVRVALPR